MKSIDILKDAGMLSFITTNYYLTADSATELRKEFAKKTAIYNIVNFNEMRIFESALGQHNAITMLRKTDQVIDTQLINVKGFLYENFIYNILNSDDAEVYTKRSDKIFEGKNYYIRISEKNDLVTKIFDKISGESKRIKQICFINTGFDSSADKVTKLNLSKVSNQNNLSIGEGIFILNWEEYNSILPEQEITFRCYKNSDVKKYYSSKWQKLYVIYTNKDTEIDNYPNVKKHLQRYRDILEYKETEHGESLPWFSHHRAREFDVFANEDKIVFPYRSKMNIFSYSDSCFMGSKDILYLRTKDNSSFG